MNELYDPQETWILIPQRKVSDPPTLWHMLDNLTEELCIFSPANVKAMAGSSIKTPNFFWTKTNANPKNS